MPTFQDGEGREWSIALSVGMVAKLRTDAKFDIGKSITDPKLVQALFEEPETVGKALWVLIERQARERKVEPEDFAFSLTADALEGAINALIEAMVDFFLPSRQRQKVKDKLPEMFAKANEKVNQQITDAIDRAMAAL
jgi:hypothetical protein